MSYGGWDCLLFGVLSKDGVAKEKVPYFRRLEVGITLFASTVMYMDCMHAVMLKHASVHFTFISVWLPYLAKNDEQ